MLPMATETTEIEFVSGQCSRIKEDNTESEMDKIMKSARALLWKELSKMNIWTCECLTIQYVTVKLV